MTQETPTLPVVVLVADLLFATRISGTARGLGVEVRMIKKTEGLDQQAGRRLIVDLGMAGAIAAAGRWKAQHQGEVVGFVSHVDQERIAQARSAGIDRVMARSGFVQQLPELLR